METNVLGLMRMTRLCLPVLVEGERRAHRQHGLGRRHLVVRRTARRTSPRSSRCTATRVRCATTCRASRFGSRTSPPGMVETNFSAVRFRDEEAGKAVYSNVAMGGPITRRGRRRLRPLRADAPAEREHRRDHRDGARPGLGRQHPARELDRADRLRHRGRRRATLERAHVAREQDRAVAPSTRIAQPMRSPGVPTAAAIGPTTT